MNTGERQSGNKDRKVLSIKRADGVPIWGVNVVVGSDVLIDGQKEVKLPDGGFSSWYLVIVSGVDTPEVYAVEYIDRSKFLIKSQSSGTFKVRWIAIGY